MRADAQRDGRIYLALYATRTSIPRITPQSLADARCWSAVQ